MPRHSKWHIALQVIALGCALAAQASGTRYAILIGSGEFPNYATIPTLDGPEYDVRSVQKLLTAWAFSAANVEVLINASATKAKVLRSLDQLAAKLQPGDYVFLYYSGHGTSGWDPKLPLHLGLDTGAIVPADIRSGIPLLPQLILASRDLRPRLVDLEKKATVFAVFDACYSGNSIKSVSTIHPELLAREVDLTPRDPKAREEFVAEFEALLRKNPTTSDNTESFPYHNLLYISASAPWEKAWEISRSALNSKTRQTVDGNPHGAFTNAFLEGLGGAADTNKYGVITYRELHDYIVENVQPAFGQLPQLLAPHNWNLSRAVVFEQKSPPAHALQRTIPSSVRIAVEGPLPELLEKITAIPHVVIAKGQYDLLVRKVDNYYELRHISGTNIRTYSATELDELVKRLSRQGALLSLLNQPCPSQDFNVSLELQPSDKDVFYLGERLQAQMWVDKNAYLLLIDVDVEGQVTVLYPLFQAEHAALPGIRVASGEQSISMPVGTELIKLFAFRDKPLDYELFAGASFSPESKEFEQFLQMIQSRNSPCAVASRVLFSVSEHP